MKKLRIKLGACWRRMRRLVLRSSEWESGNLGVLEARRNTKDGRVEIFALRSNPKHSLWLETHKDHWGKFEQNDQAMTAPPTTLKSPEPLAGQSLDAAPCYAAGDTVEVCDHSEAHGDKGKVLWTQKDGLIIVELESGCCWPVTAEELKPHND